MRLVVVDTNVLVAGLITGDQRPLNDPHDNAIVMRPAVFLEIARGGSAPP